VAEITLNAETGRALGSRSTRRLRLAGKIPGVIYGHGTEPVAVAVEGRAFRVALSGESGSNTLLELKTPEQSYLTLAREMQRHPVKGTVVHVDFQIVRRDEVISADVSINLIGEALEVQHGDGLVDQILFTLPINAKPADIPPAFELDVSALTIGSSLRVSDLALPPGVTTDVDPESMVVVGQPPRVQAEEGEGAEAAEGAEGEATGTPGAEAAGESSEEAGEGEG
jgi:large subunit ribosomal protein L25